MKKIDLHDFVLYLPTDWEDCTEDIDAPDPPLTFVNGADEVGVLQLSWAAYKSGTPPDTTPSDLRDMLDDYANKNGHGISFDHSEVSHPTAMIGRSYRQDDDYVRIWCVTDGWSVVFVSYLSSWEDRKREAVVAERIVRTIEFAKRNHA